MGDTEGTLVMNPHTSLAFAYLNAAQAAIRCDFLEGSRIVISLHGLIKAKIPIEVFSYTFQRGMTISHLHFSENLRHFTCNQYLLHGCSIYCASALVS